MGSITFRLKSSNYFGTIDVPGSVISCREVQEAIAAKISAQPEEVKVFLSGSPTPLHPAEDIQAFAVLDVVRQSSAGKPRAAFKPATPAFTAPPTASAVNTTGKKEEELTEEDRLKILEANVAMDTGISEMGARFRGRGRGRGDGGMGRGGGIHDLDQKPPPVNYVCHNCGKGGHYIQHCPNRDGKHLRVLALPTGIPEALLVECSMDDPAPKFITKNHKIVKRKIDSSAIEGTMLSAAPTKPTTAEEVPADEDTEALMCVVDHVLGVQPVKTPCCGKLMCDACFQTLLEKSLDGDDPLSCPHCKEVIMMDDVVPATEEQKKIEELRSSKKRPREN